MERSTAKRNKTKKWNLPEWFSPFKKYRWLLLIPASAFTLLAISLIGYLLIIYAGNYVIDERKLVMDSASSLVDEEGELITKIFTENRNIVSIDQIPQHVQQAFVAVEDNRFYTHRGIDGRAILRALYRDIVARSKVEGGSTITQQLAKNIFLTNEKSWLRKTKEAVIAINLERRYTKNQILEMYLNQIYFGHGAYGIDSAANLYFGVSVEELAVEQGALLAALPKAPNSFSPINNINAAKNRRDLVITLMHQQGYVSAEEAVKLQRKTIALSVKEDNDLKPYLTYIDMVIDEAQSRYGFSHEELLKGGYTITVPMAREVQRIAYERFQDDKYFPGTTENVEGAFVLMEPDAGGVLAVIGGRNYVARGLNRVNVKRQPGSTFKPLAVFAPAMEEGLFEPYSLLKDELLTYSNDYTPRNFNNEYQDTVSMYDAIKDSLNAPAVWTLNEIGIDKGKDYLNKMGIRLPDNGLAIALGGLEEGITPLDLTKAYRSFSNDGKVIQPYFIRKITDQTGNVVAQSSKVEKAVFSKQTAWYMTRMLEGVVTSGTGRAGEIRGELAGKTGTTNFPLVPRANRDTWFVGFNENVIGTVWMGYDRTTENEYLVGGGSYPTELLKDILREAELDNVAFSIPSGVKELESPIQLPEIQSLHASISFHPLRLFYVNLKWEHEGDERIVYRVYSVKDNEETFLGEVEGADTYTVNSINIFNPPKFYVVPYNTQTKQEGTHSPVVLPTMR
ncbi:transglycosylase domain-containing protein [Bacillus sp. FJAT-45066]|uniref:transglycosylase domain-containing protein n=1 Tax=Bacillus sp. FJAT-45066 TaxID=2011010 RepID=UPI000BB95534|nr:PBP1A family penicillin-binding protein [Bacillus sp. FJAT-45066]